MMSAELVSEAVNRVETDELVLLECLRKFGKGLIASGSSVGVVENTLTEIAQTYEMNCEVVALPNYIMIELGHSGRERLELAIQPDHLAIESDL